MSLVQENPLWGPGEAVGIPSARRGDRRGRMAKEADPNQKGSAPSSGPCTLRWPRQPCGTRAWASLGKYERGGRRRSRGGTEEIQAWPCPCSPLKLKSATCTWEAGLSGESGS